MKITDRIAALEALVAQQTAALAEAHARLVEAHARLAARPTEKQDPFVLTRHVHRDATTGSETTYITLQNRTGEPITLPAGHEIAFFDQSEKPFKLRGREGVGRYLKPTRVGVKPIPAKAPEATEAAPSAPEAPF